MLSIAAMKGIQADGYIFLGPLCGSARELYDYNFGRLARWADESPANLEWAQRNAPGDLALGRHYEEMLAAAAEGRERYDSRDSKDAWSQPLARRAEEIRWPPDAMFRHIRAPALVLSGSLDLNVPPEHGSRAAAIMVEAGNADASFTSIPGADHSFQIPPQDEALRFCERYTFHSFRRPYSSQLYECIPGWLRRFERTR